MKLAEYLGLPSSYLPSEIIAFGYAEKEPKATKKKDLEDIVFYNKYGKVEDHVK
ncbi:hypothetical protein HYG86_04375 [Alkalicella caledoniensis]|uniref:Nitroreductase family protein n=1 Tax=Alkalicella caledoniensis TaxID=2731377 RepID=A0A7G9W5V0_ALKCA|nr:hypothetical protein [Alkalicella caledoniensis]QNO14062.1 hypothetical protein HYG86_04375 [Alkalicella caledoniensis]